MLSVSMDDESELIRLAVGLYALHRTLNAIRFSDNRDKLDPMAMTRMFAKRAVDHQACRKLLQWQGSGEALILK